ncbi:hypothetical protein HBN50_11485 [Halobacteriovorax sp. GB3]|uniref:hypothetical protein n=1 Tax=Halobacteriovorax sp. GB3 TaxID=2719615 RepID=UPI00235E53D8|nr:hypothetical protein [Halobacteriovorax sp. GB3]MDD0853723.1 hypothetical protein [Halobacteriovorax sp. GB3]
MKKLIFIFTFISLEIHAESICRVGTFSSPPALADAKSVHGAPANAIIKEALFLEGFKTQWIDYNHYQADSDLLNNKMDLAFGALLELPSRTRRKLSFIPLLSYRYSMISLHKKKKEKKQIIGMLPYHKLVVKKYTQEGQSIIHGTREKLLTKLISGEIDSMLDIYTNFLFEIKTLKYPKDKFDYLSGNDDINFGGVISAKNSPCFQAFKRGLHKLTLKYSLSTFSSNNWPKWLPSIFLSKDEIIRHSLN